MPCKKKKKMANGMSGWGGRDKQSSSQVMIYQNEVGLWATLNVLVLHLIGFLTSFCGYYCCLKGECGQRESAPHPHKVHIIN